MGNCHHNENLHGNSAIALRPAVDTEGSVLGHCHHNKNLDGNSAIALRPAGDTEGSVLGAAHGSAQRHAEAITQRATTCEKRTSSGIQIAET